MIKLEKMFAVTAAMAMSFVMTTQTGIIVHADELVEIENMRGGVSAILDSYSDEVEETIIDASGVESESNWFYKDSYITMVLVMEKLNVRTGPNTETEILGYIDEGTIIRVISQDDEEWICVDFDGLNGYISTKYVALHSQIKSEYYVCEKPVSENPVPEEPIIEETDFEKYVETNTDKDIRTLLAALIYCEAGGEPYEGQVAVGAVVMNRVASEQFPDNIYDVIYQPGQFTPVTSGKVDRVYNSGNIYASCFDAADEALAGVNNVGNCLYFHRWDGQEEGLVILHHVFK